MQEMWLASLGWEDPLEEEMATHLSVPAWKIPWTEEPDGLQSMGSKRVRHDWATEHAHTSLCCMRYLYRVLSLFFYISRFGLVSKIKWFILCIFFFLLAFMLFVNECISEKERMRYKLVHSFCQVSRNSLHSCYVYHASAGSIAMKGQMLVFQELTVTSEDFLAKNFKRKQIIRTSILKKISPVLKSYVYPILHVLQQFSAEVIECFILLYFVRKLN